eukprot:SAG22_NODE_10176_length_549_cov_0.955556_1_plen_97_part_10
MDEAEARRELRHAVAAMTAALGEMRHAGSPALALEPHMETIARCAATLVSSPEETVGNPLAFDPLGPGSDGADGVDGEPEGAQLNLVAADASGATLA